MSAQVPALGVTPKPRNRLSVSSGSSSLVKAMRWKTWRRACPVQNLKAPSKIGFPVSIDADQHNFVREAAFEVVFLDRHVVVAADVHGGGASRFEEGEPVIEVVQIDQALFDAGDYDD